LVVLLLRIDDSEAQNPGVNGYKGIWFTLGQFSEYGDKYSGGLGTYTADHIPVAVYSPEAGKTFFIYGGTTKADERHLLIMISYYDHRTKMVPGPVVVFDKMGIDDPHDNAALSIDNEGYIRVFISGRSRLRPGYIFKSRTPYSIESFEKILEGEMTYPQPWMVNGKGFLYMFTKYTKGRELYWSTSNDSKTWKKTRDVTEASLLNHSYVRRPVNAHKDFYAFWADGDADKFSESHLYFSDRKGNKVWELPYEMIANLERPSKIKY